MNYSVAHAFVVFIKINHEDWFLMLSHFILLLHRVAVRSTGNLPSMLDDHCKHGKKTFYGIFCSN